MRLKMVFLAWLKACAALLLCSIALSAQAQWIPVPLRTQLGLDTWQAMLGQDAKVYAVARQPDGKVLIGGWFSQVNSVPRANVARLNADGTTDVSFNPGLGTDGAVLAIGVQADGKVVIGGSFQKLNGQNRAYLARLHPDGRTDDVLNAPGGWSLAPQNGGVVKTLAIQPNGQIVAGGIFSDSMYGHGGLIRFHADGHRDTSYHGNIDRLIDAEVNALVALPDGKLLVGGFFQRGGAGPFGPPGGWARNNLVRLLSNGMIDTSFSAQSVGISGVSAMAVQSSGRILISNHSYKCNMPPTPGATCINLLAARLQRLMPDGQADTAYTTHQMDMPIATLSLDADGRTLAGGDFRTVDSADRPFLALFDANGAPLHSHSSFPRPSKPVMAAAQGSGWVIGGVFDRVDGQVRQGVAKVSMQMPPTILLPLQGRCGPANGVPTHNWPDSGQLCSAGTPADKVFGRWNGQGRFDWKCRASMATAACSAPYRP